MTASERDLYFVAVKVFLEHGDKFFIFKDSYGDWDIPGGRIQRHEFDIPLDKILERKMREELGPAARYRLGKPVVFMRHERVEASTGKKARIFAIGYLAVFLGGKIALSGQHGRSKWVSIKNFNPAGCFQGGWLKGVKDYQALRRK
jgi:8-oxo-dGTP pyrophosphatase MutT (NUDIX family)